MTIQEVLFLLTDSYTFTRNLKLNCDFLVGNTSKSVLCLDVHLSLHCSIWLERMCRDCKCYKPSINQKVFFVQFKLKYNITNLWLNVHPLTYSCSSQIYHAKFALSWGFFFFFYIYPLYPLFTALNVNHIFFSCPFANLSFIPTKHRVYV